MVHDFEKQRKETEWVWHDINAREPIPDQIGLDIQFIDAYGSGDWRGFETALIFAGYSTNIYEDGNTLEAKLLRTEGSLDNIWHHEKRTTQLALHYGFQPDGWGFLRE